MQQKCVSRRHVGHKNMHTETTLVETPGHKSMSPWGGGGGHPIDINWVQELKQHSLGALAQGLPACVALKAAH